VEEEEEEYSKSGEEDSETREDNLDVMIGTTREVGEGSREGEVIVTESS
jgi:hypothetical protein